MRRQAIQYLSLDVHQATGVVSIRDEAGNGATEARAILQRIESAGPRIHVAFEEGTQAQRDLKTAS